MAVTDLTIGGPTGRALAGNGGSLSQQHYTLYMATNNLAAGNVLRVFNVPKGCVPIAVRAKVTTADSVAAATVDIGLYKQSDDTPIDADGLINELAIGAVGEVSQQPAVNNAITEDAYVGIAQGAGGGGATFNDAVIELTLAMLDLNS